MIILHDPQCADYGTSLRPEQPARVIQSVAHLRSRHPEWVWQLPPVAPEAALLAAHTAAHLKRLHRPPDFDADTPYYPDIYDHARRAAGGALEAVSLAWQHRRPAFSLMRPPGHHATADQAMGFCYLNSIAIAALAARAKGAARIAVWDFDAHHGNGTEAILAGRDGFLFVSVHQAPGYPGTGLNSTAHARNFPVPPHAPREEHLAALKKSWDAVLAFRPDFVLVSAGFDAYARDPITEMSLDSNDFATLGRWLRESGLPAAAALEGGYSEELPLLIDAFLTAWA